MRYYTVYTHWFCKSCDLDGPVLRQINKSKKTGITKSKQFSE